MFTPLLSTKFYIPRRQPLSQRTTFVPRPHLLERLEAGLTSKLTLIAAPAGFGKSTLLSEWIGETGTLSSTSLPSEHAHRPTFCWLSLEESDSDPIRFWLYFVTALQSQNLDLGADTLTLLQSSEPPPLETIVTFLLNDLNGWSPKTAPESGPAIVLVLEDYHLVTAPAIHQSLAFLLDHLPHTLHLVISTRADPPLPLARLRAGGLLSEIRADDLRFSTAETALFFNEGMGLGLSPDEVQLLTTRTEGWIAGLQLAAISMHGHEDKTGFLHSFSGDHRYILNYLIEEVLNQQSATIQQFLLHTSILNRLCGLLCDAVIGMGVGKSTENEAPPPDLSGQAMLEQLEQANLFLVSLDDLGQWYRYHQLFAEVLRYRLRQHQPEIVPILHHRASLWYEEEGYRADAIHHALLATDFARAATLIEHEWPVLWNQGAIATLFHWMQTLPEDTSPEDALWGCPSLYVSYAWGLALAGQIDEAEVVLRPVEASLQQVNSAVAASSTHQTLLGRATALRAMLAARRGVPALAVPLAEEALTLIPEEAVQRGDAYYALGLAKQQQGALTEAFRAYDSAATFGVAQDSSFLTVAARYHKARILMAQGKLQQAATAYQQLLAVAAQPQKQLPVVGLVHIGYGEILYQWNELTSAAHHVNIGLTLSPRRDLAYTDGPLHRFSILARIRQADGDREGAVAAVGMAQEMARQTGITLDRERAAALDALIHLRLGEQPIITQWVDSYERAHKDIEDFSYLLEFELLVFVRVLLSQGRLSDLLPLLARWLPTIEAAQRQGTLIEIYLVQVLAFQLDGQTEKAMSLLAHLLALAEPENYVRLFVDEGEAMRLALDDLRAWLPEHSTTEAHVSAAYLNQLLNAFANREGPRPVTSAVTRAGTSTPLLPISKLVEPLTDRELEVLHLVAAGFSNAAIAEQLVVSVGTVKTHLKHIYGKLAVQSRTQAVAHARELRLL